jgi:hypothetical protein
MIQAVAQRARGDADEVIRGIYLVVLSREPTAAETAAAKQYAQSAGLGPKQAIDDLVWALINTKEFLYRH